ACCNPRAGDRRLAPESSGRRERTPPRPAHPTPFCADCLMSSEYLAPWPHAFQAGCAVLLVRYALLFAARLRNQPVLEVLPDRPMLFQVDEHADLVALLIGYKTDSGHGPVLR